MSKRKNTIKKFKQKKIGEQLSFNFRPMQDDNKKRSNIVIKIDPERYKQSNNKEKESKNHIINKFIKHSENLDW